MKTIPLTHGKVAIVDSEDYQCLSQFKWRAQKSGKRHDSFYAVRNVTIKKRRTTIQMHRQIMQPPQGLEIDHKNNNGLDNRRSNLRFCTRSQNMANSRGHRRRFSSFKGVSLHKEYRKWRVRITHNGKNQHVGFFRSEVRAAKAYDDKAKELFGEFAHPNFPYQLRRRNIYRWLMETNGRAFSVTFIKRSTGKDKTIRARLDVKTKINGKDMRYNTRNKRLIVVFDMQVRKHKCIPIEAIEAVKYRGRRYMVD